MDSITEYWQRHALANIMPWRDGAEFPDGPLVLEELARLVGPGEVLEFGCGRGRLAPLFAADKYTGVDISLPAIEHAKANNPEHAFELIEPFAELPRRPTVFAYTVLHHIPDELLLPAIGQLCAAADRVLVAEIMEPAWRHERTPPCLNRSPEEYFEAFARFGRYVKHAVTLKYAAYADRKITIIELR